MKRLIEITADSSATIYIPELNEHYHSVKGADTESRHVYINTGWQHIADKHSHRPIVVAEAGMGTGLNVVLTAMEATKRNIPTIYHALELYPLEPETLNSWLATVNPSLIDIDTLHAVHKAQWETQITVNPTFTLIKNRTDMTRPGAFGPEQSVDVIYYDAFAPDVQPELWTPAQIERVAMALRQGGVLVTYCAKGSVRRAMQAAGLTVERLPGPPAGKREILRASKP